jgi:CheY-like chemotaxis protein
MSSVLVVEDNDDLRFLYGQALSEEGYDVHLAANGQEALDMLRQMSVIPRLILLDLMMPVMDGKEFLVHQAADPSLANIPVVICSASRAGVSAQMRLLKKPVDLQTLLDLVKEYLGDTSLR